MTKANPPSNFSNDDEHRTGGRIHIQHLGSATMEAKRCMSDRKKGHKRPNNIGT